MMGWRLAVLGLVAYACALVATAPASLLDAALHGASGGILRLTEAQGGLWSGAGRLEIRAGSGRPLVGQDLRWRLVPGQLLRARLAFELQVEQGAQALLLSLGAGRVEIAGANIGLPASVLSAAQPKLAPLQLTGDLSLQIGRLLIVSGNWSGTMIVRWRHAGSALTQVYPLGDYDLQFAGEGGAARISLITRSGPLQLDGRGSLSREGKLAFTANARIEANFRSALEPLMRLIAVERSDGSYELQLG